MDIITPDRLRRFSPWATDGAEQAAALEAARKKSTINSPRRVAHFLAQCYVETAGFTTLTENLNYRDPLRLDAMFRAVTGTDDAQSLIMRGPQAIANRVYASRLGNGPEATGDGWRYRGAGYLQITGKRNFGQLGVEVGLDLVTAPELLHDYGPAAEVACRYWDVYGCSPEADAGDLEAITRIINGPAMANLKERREALGRALDIFGSTTEPYRDPA